MAAAGWEKAQEPQQCENLGCRFRKSVSEGYLGPCVKFRRKAGSLINHTHKKRIRTLNRKRFSSSSTHVVNVQKPQKMRRAVLCLCPGRSPSLSRLSSAQPQTEPSPPLHL